MGTPLSRDVLPGRCVVIVAELEAIRSEWLSTAGPLRLPNCRRLFLPSNTWSA